MSLSSASKSSGWTEERSEKKNQPSTSTVTGAFLLIAQQFGSRCLTFTANQILLRYISPEILGISMQLELYYITVLFFSRESLRYTLQRYRIEPFVVDHPQSSSITQEKKEVRSIHIQNVTGKIQAIVNLAYVSLFLGIGASFVFAWLFLSSINTRDLAIVNIPYLKISLIIFAGASILELLAEPCYVVVQQKSFHYVRVASESTATVLRCLTVCISTIYAFKVGLDVGVLPFAFGQVVYSISLLAVYYFNVITISSNEGFSLLPRPIQSPMPNAFFFSYFSRSLLSLSRSFFIQSLFKYALTQGDTFIISLLASPNVQGEYSLANNYGSLVARLILQPIEEISRNYFGKLLSTTDKHSEHAISRAHKSLLQLIYLYFIVSIFVVSLGPTAAPIVLKIIAGPRWAETGAGQLLALYCYYIPLLAVNGLTEAFVSSVATESELHYQTAWMLVFSIIFSGAAFLFLRVYQLGARGLLAANSLNMFFRIIWASIFIKSYVRRWQIDIKLRTLIPRPITVAAGVAVFAFVTRTETSNSDLQSLCTMAAVAGALFLFICMVERKHFLDLVHEHQKQI